MAKEETEIIREEQHEGIEEKKEPSNENEVQHGNEGEGEVKGEEVKEGETKVEEKGEEAKEGETKAEVKGDSGAGAEEQHEKFDPLHNLNESQLEALEEMRKKAEEYAQDDKERKWCNDMCLLRYLRARDYHVNKSEKMLKATLEWKREFHPDEITVEETEPIARTGCVYHHGLDKKYRPIIMMRPYKDAEIKGSGHSEVKFKHLLYWLEKGFKNMDESRGVESLCLVVDYSHYGRKHMDTKTNMHVLHYMLNHLPERLGVAIFLDPPLLFWVGWKIISPFLNSVTMAKVKFLYTKKSKETGQRSCEDLFDYIDKDVLEAEFGGNNTKVYDYDSYVSNNYEIV